jgi:hypothetical protein
MTVTFDDSALDAHMLTPSISIPGAPVQDARLSGSSRLPGSHEHDVTFVVTGGDPR